jgi:amino acid transporter
MESASIPVDQGVGVVDPTAPGAKGLKANALGYASNLVIAVASTAPAYSLAATLGFIVAVPAMGVHAPAVLIVSFIPILFVSVGYRFLNLADPDAGTTFAWVTRAFGPWVGWVNGWAIFLADVIVMASLAAIASLFALERTSVELRTDRRRRDLDRPDDVDLLSRHRAVGPDSAVPAQPGDLHAGPVRDRGAGQGLLEQPAAQHSCLGVMVQPV